MPAIRPPLQINVVADSNDDDAKAFIDILVAAVAGSRQTAGYLPAVDDLGIQITIYTPGSPPPRPSAKMLSDFQHTFVVVLVGYTLVANGKAGLWKWLGECFAAIAASGGAHSALPVLLDERAGSAFISKHPSLAKLQSVDAHSFGERAVRPAIFALRVLHECRLLLAPKIGGARDAHPGFLRLFISHAKLDGLPLARALRHQLHELPWLKAFYDADDLPPGRDWEKELQAGVGSSIIVILRTEFYDQRFWCQQEVLWSEEYATPAVLVEARTGLNHPAGTLPFDRVPAVRIPDGNLLRIVFLAIREGLRFLYFMAKIEEMKRTGDLPANVELRVFCSPPSMPALLRACLALQEDPAMPAKPRMILYPDPPLRAGVREAALALVERYAPGARLLTPLTLMTASAAGSP